MKKIFVLSVFLLFTPLSASAAISFVGSCTPVDANNGGNATLTLPAGTAQNDLVIVAYGIGDNDNVDFNMALTTGGYTEVADLFSNDTDDASLGVYWKVMGAVPDTSAVASGLGGTDTDTVAVCMVFRGVDTTTPMDVTPTTATGIDTMHPNPPSINHNNPAGVWTVIAGTNGTNAGAQSFTFPTGYTTDKTDVGGTDTTDGAVGLGYRSSGVSDPEDPGTMTLAGTDSTSYAWAAATIALRPASGSAPTVTTDSAQSFTPTSATLFGNITDTGGLTGAGTAYGFAVSTNSSLSSGVSTTSIGTYSGTGSYSLATTTLSANTTYYYRAYASNSAGTGFGTIKSFTTGNNTPSRMMRLFEGFTIRLMEGFRLILFGR